MPFLKIRLSLMLLFSVLKFRLLVDTLCFSSYSFTIWTLPLWTHFLRTSIPPPVVELTQSRKCMHWRQNERRLNYSNYGEREEKDQKKQCFLSNRSSDLLPMGRVRLSLVSFMQFRRKSIVQRNLTNQCQVRVCINWVMSLEHEGKEGITLLHDSMSLLDQPQCGPFETGCGRPYLLC